MRVLENFSWEASQKLAREKRANEDRFEDQWYYRRFVNFVLRKEPLG